MINEHHQLNDNKTKLLSLRDQLTVENRGTENKLDDIALQSRDNKIRLINVEKKNLILSRDEYQNSSCLDYNPTTLAGRGLTRIEANKKQLIQGDVTKSEGKKHWKYRILLNKANMNEDLPVL